jgi:hypothetical protein
MIARGFGWLIAAGLLWVFASSGNPEIYALFGAGALFVGALTCTIQAISKFFPHWFDPLAMLSRELKRSKREDSASNKQ